MKEVEYIQATNLAKLRCATGIIEKVLASAIEPWGITPEEKQRVFDVLDICTTRLERTRNRGAVTTRKKP